MKLDWNNKPAKGTDLRFDGDAWSVKSAIENWWTTAAFIPPRISVLRKVGKELTAGICSGTFFTANTKLGSPRHKSPFEDYANIATALNLPLFRELIARTCVGFVGSLQGTGEWQKVDPAQVSVHWYTELPITDSVVIRYASTGTPTRGWVEIAEAGSKSKVFGSNGHHDANRKYAEHLHSFIEWAKAGDPQGIIDWSRLEAVLAPIPVPEPVLKSGAWKLDDKGEISLLENDVPEGWNTYVFDTKSGQRYSVAPFLRKQYVWVGDWKHKEPNVYEGRWPQESYEAAVKVWEEKYGSSPELEPIRKQSPAPEPKPLVLASWQVQGKEVGEIEDVSHRDLEAMGWYGASFPLPDGTFLFVAPTWNHYVFHTSRQFGRLAGEDDWNYYRVAILVWARELGEEESSFPKFIH